MVRIMKKIRMKRVRWCMLIATGMVMVAAGYVYGVYTGNILLNNPSVKKYPIRGIDVSHYQGDIDWSVLEQENIRFAFIKATEGSMHIDDRFDKNWEGAMETSLAVGAYHFFSFDSPGESQAQNFIAVVDEFENMLPPVVDVEFYADKKQNPPNPDEVQVQLQVFLDKIQENYGLTPVIYATEEAWELYIKGRFDQYPLWIRNVIRKPRTGNNHPWTFWQYTNREKLEGYSGVEEFIDMNVFYGDEIQWEEFLQGR